MLYGSLEAIQNQYTGHDVLLKTRGVLPEMDFVLQSEKTNGSSYRVSLPADITSQQYLRLLIEKNVDVEQFEVAVPTLDEIFIQVVQAEASVG